MVKSISTIRELRLVIETWRRRDETIGFVPTMGALHEGHVSLVRQAQSLSTRIVTSIFVNPMQFGNEENCENYPRTPGRDEKFLNDCGCDILFAPDVETVYPSGFSTKVDPGPLGDVFEGVFRPGHFAGVATVVVKLLMQVQPDYAFFGEKDFQQLRIVEQVVRDLNIPVSIIPVPLYREPDGLPSATRNALLSHDERALAANMPRTLETAVQDIRDGHDIEATLSAAQQHLEVSGFQVDYFELVDSRTLAVARDLKKPTRIITAVRLGKVRLLDNMAV